ncbi:WD40 repeat-like protein [Mycena venus]|uniref:WD40 repeat-like protein n=1 Tax=Mycena venus TaxID=2733690 RepID=A0A8H6X6D3_9AGAR|nr:WD40 repeat-like protein [Mycena venus]
MSSDYSLLIQSADGISWKPGSLHRKSPRFYVTIHQDGGKIHRIHTVTGGHSAKWDSISQISADSPSARISLRLFHDSRLGDECIASVDTDIKSLWDLCNSDGKAKVVKLDLLGVKGKLKGSTVGTLSVSLMATQEGAALAVAGHINPIGSALYAVTSKLEILVKIGDQISMIHPYANIAWKVLTSVYKAVKHQNETDEKLLDLTRIMVDTYSFVGTVDFLDKIKSVEETALAIVKQTVECSFFIQKYMAHGFSTRTVQGSWNNAEQNIDKLACALRELKQSFENGLMVQSLFVSTKILDVVEHLDQSDMLRKLNPVDMNATSRSLCLVGTRCKILDDITEWATGSSDAGNILWLSGVAGSGKSTVSTTIAESLRELERLGAFLFFDRNDQARSHPDAVIRTIAYWLSLSSPHVGSAIAATIRRDPAIVNAPLLTQFTKLLLDPLQVAEPNITGPILSVSFLPDGTLIVSGSDDNTLCLWDAKTGAAVGKPLEGHTGGVTSVSFSPDGTQIVSGSDDKTLRLWDAQTGALVGEPLEGHTGGVTSVSFSLDGTQIVSGSNDKTLHLWDAQTGAPIASGSDDQTLRLWDAKTGAPLGEPLEGHTNGVKSVSFSPDGTQIVSGSKDKTLCLWDVKTGTMIGVPLEGHTDWVTSVSFSPDGTQIVSGSDDRTLCLWDAQTGALVGEPLEGHSYSITSVSFSPHGTQIVFGTFDKTLHLWDVQTEVPVDKPLGGHTDWVKLCLGLKTKLCASGMLKQGIVSGSDDKTLRLWDAQTGLPIGAPLEGHNDWVNSVSFSPDGTQIVSGSSDRTLRLWDTETRAPIVSGSNDKTLRLWNAQTGAPVGEPLKGHTGNVTSVSFSPDGTQIGHLKGKPLEGHTDLINSVSFSPDSTWIVSGSYDKTLRLWDAQTGAPIGAPLEGHNDWVTSVSFSPDGTQIVSGSDDKTLRLWNAQIGALTGPVIEMDPEVGTLTDAKHDGMEKNTVIKFPAQNPLGDFPTFKDEWVLNTAGKLMFWVPPWRLHGLYLPLNTLVICKEGTTKLNLTQFVYGKDWQKCIDPAFRDAQ